MSNFFKQEASDQDYFKRLISTYPLGSPRPKTFGAEIEWNEAQYVQRVLYTFYKKLPKRFVRNG